MVQCCQNSCQPCKLLLSTVQIQRILQLDCLGFLQLISPIVFCIHGNKWAVAQGYEDLEDHSRGGNEPMNGYQAYSRDGGATWTGSKDSEHCHRSRKTGIDKKARRKLMFASVLCMMFMIGEVVGGVLSNSLAITTDAAHLLTDLASFMISLFAIFIAAKPNSHRMPFGWHRAEVLGATVSVLMIWVVTGILVYMAVQRLITPDFEIDAKAMLITSAVGVGFNIVMGCNLHQHGHSHGGDTGGHGHSHDTEAGAQAENSHDKDQENIIVKAAFIHVVGDFLQSLGVFVAAIIIYFNPTWVIIDPICTFMFSLLVLATTLKILKDTINVLMEGTPEGINYDDVQKILLSVDGIQQIHSLRIWALTTNKSALAAHLVIKGGLSAQAVLQDATTKIRARYDFFEMTLQVEEFQEEMETCNQCKDPAE